MIERYAGDHSQIRLHQIGRIQPAAQADLQQDQIRRRGAEQPECRQGTKLEEGQRDLSSRRLNGRKRLTEIRIGGILPLDPHPFVVAQQMGR